MVISSPFLIFFTALISRVDSSSFQFPSALDVHEWLNLKFYQTFIRIGFQIHLLRQIEKFPKMMTSIQNFSRKQKINKYFVNKIRRFVNWWLDARRTLEWSTH